MWWIFLAACGPASPDDTGADEVSVVPTDGWPAWRDAALAGCVVTQDSAWTGGNSENRWTDTYDADGQKIATIEDSRADGIDDLSWTHVWTGETVDTTGASLNDYATFTDVERRVFDGPRRLRWEIDSAWFAYDYGEYSAGAYVTTWDGDLPAREDWYSEPEAVTLYGGATWDWADDQSEAVVTLDDGRTWTYEYDADLQLVAKRVAPVPNGSPYTVVTEWRYGDRGPIEMTFDNDEDGQIESTTTWTYDCP